MDEAGKKLIMTWELSRDNLASMFSKRKYQEAVEPMLKNLTYFKQSLYLLNNQVWSEESLLNRVADNFKYKPFNVVERVNFISDNPHQYHSYIQLNELFKELEKIYAKAEIMEKKKNI